ncbi:MAG: hypothetical protein M3544_00615 [Pseudomonadota bacterium]|nr:hypothetical protein [Pseudomonadota bacterium]
MRRCISAAPAIAWRHASGSGLVSPYSASRRSRIDWRAMLVESDQSWPTTRS